MKFATKYVSYISPQCYSTTLQNTKDRNWQNSAARNAITLVHEIKYYRQNKIWLYGVKL